MIRTAVVPARLQGANLRLAKAAERESARGWNIVVEWGREMLRNKQWPDAYELKKRLLALPAPERPKLHTHATQEICFDYEAACKTAKENRASGRKVRYPHKEKRFRPITFTKGFGWTISRRRGEERLKLSFGKTRIYLAIPVVGAGPSTWGEIKLVWAGRNFDLHIPYEVADHPECARSGRLGAIDPGIIHAMACVAEGEDGKLHTLVISGREARSVKRHRNKKVGQLARAQSRLQTGSKRWRRIQRAKGKVKGEADRRLRDIDHKTSRMAADFFNVHGVETVYLGDVSGIEAKTRQNRRLNRIARQQVSQWSRGRQERYLEEKLHCSLDRVGEAHTSQTCPACGTRRKVAGRTYRCQNPACGFTWHRDGVGALNILSRGKTGTLAAMDVDRLAPITYRQPTRHLPAGRDGVVALNRASAKRRWRLDSTVCTPAAVMSGGSPPPTCRLSSQTAAEGATPCTEAAA